MPERKRFFLGGGFPKDSLLYKVGSMKEKPKLSWKAEQDAMYTVGEASFEQIEKTFSGDDC